jgi:hypothetical protein
MRNSIDNLVCFVANTLCQISALIQIVPNMPRSRNVDKIRPGACVENRLQAAKHTFPQTRIMTFFVC